MHIITDGVDEWSKEADRLGTEISPPWRKCIKHVLNVERFRIRKHEGNVSSIHSVIEVGKVRIHNMALQLEYYTLYCKGDLFCLFHYLFHLL